MEKNISAHAQHDPALEAQPTVMVGRFFHSRRDGEIEWQGHIVGAPAPGLYLVELGSWLTGCTTHSQLVRLEDMVDWTFYGSVEEMNDAAEREDARA